MRVTWWFYALNYLGSLAADIATDLSFNDVLTMVDARFFGQNYWTFLNSVEKVAAAKTTATHRLH